MNARCRRPAAIRTLGVAAFLLLGSALVGCRREVPAPPPVVATAPPLTPASITVITPLPSIPAETKPNVTQAKPEVAVVAPAPAPPKRKRRIRHKTVPPAGASVAANSSAGSQANSVSDTVPASMVPVPGAGSTGSLTPAESAASTAMKTGGTSQEGSIVGSGGTATSASSTSAAEAATTLGELSAGTTISGSERTEILRAIQAQEVRLAKVGMPGTGDARAVQMQVRSFLAKARQAVIENDLDGARTLNTKAMVLLNELQGE